MAPYQPTGTEIFDLAATQNGKLYRYGSEVAHNMWSLLHAKSWDCAEITEVCHAVRGVYLPDGSGAQGDFLKPHRIPISQAATIKGALIGKYPRNRNPGHVVFSAGDGIRTFEAMGTKYGVRYGKIASRGFTWAALVPGVSYPDRLSPVASPPPKGSLAELAQAVFYARQFHLGAPGVQLNSDAVKIAQAGLNRWFTDFARLTNQPPPPPLAVDGVWGPQTRDWVILLQRLTGINELGTVGAATWTALYP